MSDPLAQVVLLLQLEAPYSKIAVGAGRWLVHRETTGRPFYCAVLSGGMRIAVDGYEEMTLDEGDFVLIPAAPHFTMASLEKTTERDARIEHAMLPNGDALIGQLDGPRNVRALIGYCGFGSPDAALLVSLLPALVRIRTEARLETLVHLVRDEFRAQRPARDVVLARLLEVVFIEALRSGAGTEASPGLLRGLADERVAPALKRMHERPDAAWSVQQLAREASLSRSAFFDRFTRAVGVAPMEYLLAWRMALAKNMLRTREHGVAEVARRVGYSSASTFSVAFARHVGSPPARYARDAQTSLVSDTSTPSASA